MSHPGPTFIEAFAKVNLTLEVLGKRPDGYHNLASVMQTIALHDSLAVQLNDTGEFTCLCDVPELNTPDNLVLRAARLLLQEASRTASGVQIDLHKETPTQAGLGGGSSDAAAILKTLNDLWDLELPPKRLLEIAAQLGSDVPFFLAGGTAWIEGRGEQVTPLPDAEPLWLLLAKPAIGIPTPLVFQSLTPDEYGTGTATATLAAAIRAGAPIPFAHLTNTLEAGVFRAFPAVAAVHQALLDAGAPVVRMSGSGPSLFAPFRRLQEAHRVFQRVRALQHTEVWLTHSVTQHAQRLS